LERALPVDCELLIKRLGAQDDGIAEMEGVPVFVPFTLPGERILARVTGDRGKLIEVLEPSGERISPVCAHFGSCGGCAMQHMSARSYGSWKRKSVVAAFRARGL
jgi:23S rRNA (uracil1939-C5)-methyltransferase